MLSVYETVQEAIGNHPELGIADLSALFDDRPETIYFVSFHTSEHGNQIVAAAMVEVLVARSALQ